MKLLQQHHPLFWMKLKILRKYFRAFVLQLIGNGRKTVNNLGVHCEPFFFRTADGYGLDLVLRVKGRLWTFEMKLTTNPGQRDLEKLIKAAAMIHADRIVLVSRSNRTIRGQDAIATGVKGLLDLISEIQ